MKLMIKKNISKPLVAVCGLSFLAASGTAIYSLSELNTQWNELSVSLARLNTGYVVKANSTELKDKKWRIGDLVSQDVSCKIEFDGVSYEMEIDKQPAELIICKGKREETYSISQSGKTLSAFSVSK